MKLCANSIFGKDKQVIQVAETEIGWFYTMKGQGEPVLFLNSIIGQKALFMINTIAELKTNINEFQGLFDAKYLDKNISPFEVDKINIALIDRYKIICVIINIKLYDFLDARFDINDHSLIYGGAMTPPHYKTVLDDICDKHPVFTKIGRMSSLHDFRHFCKRIIKGDKVDVKTLLTEIDRVKIILDIFEEYLMNS